jgi:hypothetical protein
MRGNARRLAALEAVKGGAARLITVKALDGADVGAMLAASGVERRPSDLLVHILRPEGCGADMVRVSPCGA